jgi:zinc/manganese transport system substrate-binding protein
MRTVLVLLLALGLGGCGSGDGPDAGRPAIVVTTSVLGDVVQQLVGDGTRVQVLMPAGVDPHDFAASARQAVAMREADALVVNGRGLEASLADAIDAAEADGVVVIRATDALTDGATDPHFVSDPVLMADAVRLIADRLLAAVPGLDTATVRQATDSYLVELGALDAEVSTLVAPIPPDRRVLVTNHEVFGYFARRYGFEVLGAVVPGGSTLAQPSAAALAALAELIAARDVPAIFADTSSPTRLVDALAAEGADVEVVALYSESLGRAGSDGDTYIGMMRTNAERIAAALG